MQDGEAHEFVYRLQQGSVPQPAAIHSSSGCAGPAAAHHWPWIAHRQVRVEKGDPRFSASRTAVVHPAPRCRISTHTSPLPLPTSPRCFSLRPLQVNILSPGVTFGEMSFLDGTANLATPQP